MLRTIVHRFVYLKLKLKLESIGSIESNILFLYIQIGRIFITKNSIHFVYVKMLIEFYCLLDKLVYYRDNVEKA